MQNYRDLWHAQYKIVPEQLKKSAEINCVATAFNCNIDAVVKLSGKQISQLAEQFNLNADEALNNPTTITCPRDVICGILKCFILGIAEEWLIEDAAVYQWVSQKIGYDRLQMGGQGGIVANVAALLGVKNVLTHTASLPNLQAEQFLDLANLFGIDADKHIMPARKINRPNDLPLVHQIIEFAKDDEIKLGEKTYKCPKANRFIATYDKANMALIVDNGFVQHLNQTGFDYLILSGFHNLTENNNGISRINAIVPLINEWKQRFPNGIIHLELASTQDKIIRQAIIEKIAPIADSIGLNEREALDILEVIDSVKYEKIKTTAINAAVLFEIIQQIKQKTQTPRIQLHMFGLYMTLQNKKWRITPEQNRNGMMLAATIAASKAGLGQLESAEDLLWAHGQKIGEKSLQELQILAQHVDSATLEITGMASVEEYDLIAVPTIIVPQPKTLVGMGDTISSVSLIGAL